MKRISTIFILLQFLVLSYGNNGIVDSLKNELQGKIIKNDSLLFKIYTKLSFYSKNPKDKLLYSNLAFDCGEKANKLSWKGSAKFQESYVYIKIGDLDRAIGVLLISKDFYHKASDSKGVASVDCLLANVYDQNQEYKKSEKAYKDAIFYFKNVGDSLSLAYSYLNIGELYRKIGDDLNACFFNEKALYLYQLLNYSYGIAYANGNIGLVCVIQNKLDSAEVYLNKSISILEPLGDNYAVSSYLDGLAGIYFKRKKYSRAKAIAHKSLSLAQEYGLKEQIRDASLRLAAICCEIGKYKDAYRYKSKYIDYRDSINNEETIRKIANLHTKYEVTQKQKEVDELNAQKQYYLVIAISLIIIVGLFVILVVIMLKNSKDRIKANKQLELKHKELEKSDAAKNKFFSILSHDIRGSVGVFSSFADVIKLNVENKEYDQLEPLVDELERSSLNLLDLTDNLLHWGVKQMGAVKNTYTQVEVLSVVNKDVNYLKDISQKKNISVIIDIPSDLVLWVDQESLSIALRNLVSNAIKFTDKKGEVLISAQSNAANTIIKISDNGVGITPEQKKNLFDFSDVSSTYGTQNEKGIGLGLQLVCGFVKSHHATIEVESEVGKGTTFILSFSNKQ